MTRRSLLLVLAGLLVALNSFGEDATNPRAEVAQDLREAIAASQAGVSRFPSEVLYPNTPCYAGEIKCAQTKTGRVSVDSCEANGVYGVGYLFVGTAGQRVTITGRSPEFGASLALTDGRQGNNTIYAQNHTFSDGATARIDNFSLPRSGDYFIIITPLTAYEFGDYTLTVTCQSAPPPPPPCTSTCTANANTACMLNDRFKVTMTWNDPSAGLSGSGRLITYSDARPVIDPINGEISESTFWSMYAHDPNSLEALVRMIRGGSSYWIFVTGFASAEYTVTVQDTRTCATWSRTTPFGSKEKITDFNAFPFP